MAVVGDIYNALDSFCPFEVHEPWDNVGLLVGEKESEVRRAAVVLDITPDAVKKAHEAGAQLIVSHHPVIFHPIKNLGAHDPVYLLAKYGMNALCAHTNLDCADGGVNDVLAQCLGLENVRKIPSPSADTMLLRAGELKDALSPKNFAELVSQRLCCHVRYCDGGRSIKRVALCGGAGGEFFSDALAFGCEALVSGDVSHHEFLGAELLSLPPVILRRKTRLSKHFSNILPELLTQWSSLLSPSSRRPILYDIFSLEFYLCRLTDLHCIF